MAWDDNKGPGDGLPSSEWNIHVDEQKKNRPIVQEAEPPVGDEGQEWVKPIIERFTTTDYGASYSPYREAWGDYVVRAQDSSGPLIVSDLDGNVIWTLQDPPWGAGTSFGQIFSDNGNVFIFKDLDGDSYPSYYEYDIATGSLVGSDTDAFEDDGALDVYEDSLVSWTPQIVTYYEDIGQNSWSWSVTNDSNYDEPFHIGDTNVYLHYLPGDSLRVFARSNGTEVWNDSFDVVAIDHNDNYVVAADSAERLRKYDKSGNIQWTVDVNGLGAVYSVNFSSNGNILVGYSIMLAEYAPDGALIDTYRVDGANFNDVDAVNNNGLVYEESGNEYLFDLVDATQNYTSDGVSWVPSRQNFL